MSLIAFGLALTLGACVHHPHPLQRIVIPEVPPDAGARTISMGEPIVTFYGCPWADMYKAEREISIDGYRTIPAESLWEARFRNTESGSIYLVNESYHRQVAVVADGRHGSAFRGRSSPIRCGSGSTIVAEASSMRP